MKSLIKGFTYAFKRNIGWQDRAIRTIAGIASVIGAVYFYKINSVAAIALAVLAVAQVWTVLSAKCIICYFTGICTITKAEQQSLQSKGVPFEK